MGLFSRKKKEPNAPAASAAVEPSGPAPTDAEAIQRELRECLARLSEGKLAADAIDPRSHLFDFGYLDSFRSAELLAFVERRFGVQVPEMQLVGKLCTVDALSRHIGESGVGRRNAEGSAR
jgi:acyl carrier protein